tara:strand:+ start:7604 stop:7804 length:201 start_codon:yes stop_codon:yes gene_type:complete
MNQLIDGSSQVVRLENLEADTTEFYPSVHGLLLGFVRSPIVFSDSPFDVGSNSFCYRHIAFNSDLD